MEKKHLIYAMGIEMLAKRFINNVEGIRKDVQVNLQAYISEFQCACGKLFEKAINKQEANELGEVCFLCISLLKSSLLTESFDVQLALYDSDFYLGRSVSTYWHPLFIYKYFEQDISMFSSYIKRKIPQVKDYEVQDYKIDFISNYHILLHRFCVENAWSALSVPSYNGMIKSENIKILFGEYMMPMGEIHSTSTE